MRFLCAVDGSPSSQQAVATAARLAVATGGSVVVVHVRTASSGVRSPADETQATALEVAVLAAARNALEAAGVRDVTSLVSPAWSDDVAAAINQAAEEKDVDFVVVGHRGMSTLAELFLGSVAEKLLKTSGRPVVVAR